MKSLMIALCLMISGLAEARSPINFKNLTLSNVKINDDLNERLVVQVELAYLTNTMKLNIFDDRCGSLLPDEPNAIRCKAMAVLVESIETPFTMIQDGCGTVTYQVVDDRRPVDGNLTEMNFVDHSNRVCENNVPNLYVLDAKITSARGGKVRTYAAAGNNELSPVRPLQDDEAIYKALNVEEVDLNPGIVGAFRRQKSVGGLVCIASAVVVPNAKTSYSCTLNR